MVASKQVIVDTTQVFSKQSYRNRTYISHHAGALPLIVPIAAPRRVRLQEVRIDNSLSWRRVFWGSIKSAYGSAPYYEHYAHDYYELLSKSYTFLCDLSLAALNLLNEHLGMKGFVVHDSPALEPEVINQGLSSGYTDARVWHLPHKKPSQQTPYRAYRYEAHSYAQVFEGDFIPNLSLLDLLFNAKPMALKILETSLVPTNRLTL